MVVNIRVIISASSIRVGAQCRLRKLRTPLQCGHWCVPIGGHDTLRHCLQPLGCHLGGSLFYESSLPIIYLSGDFVTVSDINVQFVLGVYCKDSR